VAGAEPGGWSGHGQFVGAWRGTLAEPVCLGRVSGQEVGFLGVSWGRAEWTGASEPQRIRLDSLVVRRDGAELRLEGWMETGMLGEEDALDLRVGLTRWPAGDLVSALAWDVDLQGPVTGEAVLSGRRSAPAGTARFASPSGTFSGVRYEALEVASVLRGAVTEVTSGAATVAGGRISFRGVASDDGTYDGEATARGVDLAALPGLSGGGEWRGQLSGHAVGVGSLERPRLTARVEGEGLALAGESIGNLEATLRGQGDGSLRVEAHTTGRVALALAGTMGMAAPHEAALTISMAQSPLDPFLRALHAALPPAVALSAAAQATVRGPLARPAELSAEVEVTGVYNPGSVVSTFTTTRFRPSGAVLMAFTLFILTGGCALANPEGSYVEFINSDLFKPKQKE
jgi:autotransporter translocation and assembly factor TamB